jgi:hypothetical protein
MMKRLKTSTSISLAPLLLSAICVAIVFALSPAVAQAQKGGPMQSDASLPIPGIGVAIRKNPGSGSARRTQTDAEGNYKVDGLEPGAYILVIEIPSDATATTQTNNARSLPQSRSEIRPVGDTEWLGAEGWPYQFTLGGNGVSRKSGSITLQDRDTGTARKAAPEAQQKVTVIEVAFDVTGDSTTNITGKITLPNGGIVIKNIGKPN